MTTTYTAKYLPTGEKKEPGRTVMNSSGDIHVIRDEEDMILILDTWKVARLFFVYDQYNVQVTAGYVSDKATWIKAGDKVKSADTREGDGCLEVKCQCGTFH